MAPPLPTAFVSYSRDDKEFARKLAADLKAACAPVWLDQLDIPPGRAWDMMVEDALTASPDAADSFAFVGKVESGTQ